MYNKNLQQKTKIYFETKKNFNDKYTILCHLKYELKNKLWTFIIKKNQCFKACIFFQPFDLHC